MLLNATRLVVSLFALSSLVIASSSGDEASPKQPQVARHAHRSHAHAVRSTLEEPKRMKRSPSSKKKRCVAKPTGTATSTSTKTKTTAGSNATATGSSSSGGGSSTTGPSGGLITVVDAKCGPNGATKASGLTSGPNGSEKWLNCGVDGGGWTPPVVTMEDAVYVPLATALQDSKSPFQSCKKYLSIFEAAAKKYNIPDILLASFAQQESSCNPSTRGGGGEVGMFQLSQDKCPGGKSSSACLDPTTNTNLAAAYISKQLDSMNGNLLQMIGEYNGWSLKMTVADATKAAHSSCCRCQNNLDYIHQFMNGWMQNKDAYSVKMGTYQNLDKCPNQGANGRRWSRLEREAFEKVERDLMGTPPNRWRF
jgi:hypothetical protein